MLIRKSNPEQAKHVTMMQIISYDHRCLEISNMQKYIDTTSPKLNIV